MCLVVVVAVEDGVVDELHLISGLVVLGHWLFRQLSFPKRRWVRPLDIVHESTHQLLTKSIKRASSNLLYFFLSFPLHGQSIQWVADRLFNWLVLDHSSVLFFSKRVNWSCLHLYILLNLILLISFFFLVVVVSQLILKKFSICQSWEFLTEFDVLIFAEMIASFIEAHIFCVGEPTDKIFGLNHGGGLRSISIVFIFLLAGL